MKRLSVAALIIAVTIFLSGCSVASLDGSDIMCPPNATGSKADIQELVDSQASGDYTLKYPKSGNYRSSIILHDVDNDEEQESIAFYTTADKKVHMLFVQCQDDDYSVAADIISPGTDIDLVDFADLDGDKKIEVLIGYRTTATSQNILNVYRFSSTVEQLDAQYSYSDIVTGDFNSDKKDDVLMLSLHSGDNSAQAKLMMYSNNGLSEIGSTALDSDVIQFASAKYGLIGNGRYGAVIDGILTTGDYSTQVIYFDLSLPALTNPLYSYSEYNKTQRSTQVCSCDINGDDIIEIPICTQMGYSDSENIDTVSRQINWSQVDFDAMYLSTVQSDIICATDGYLLHMPSKWVDSVTARYDSKTKETTVYAWDYSDNAMEKTSELITVKAVSKDDFEDDPGDFTQLQTSGSTVYCYKLYSNDSYLDISGDDIVSMFSLVTNI